MPDLKSQAVAETVDVLGRVCPYPLVLTKKAMEKLSSGQILKVITDAQASAEDSIPKYAEKNKFEIESVKLENEGYWEIYIKKS